ncbi:MAG TPA: hypothetical protein VG537_11900, partial [Candidatus Kapabacteria bacterium]|nr:hypothetical protein [Candidatus Kapabacteria bacterium]
MFAITAWVLTHTAGWQHPFWWQLTLTVALLTGLTFAGLTARYISERWYALQISIVLYFLVFTSILNVFFWYSDLTYGLELAFTTPAWYFGLRGLREAKMKYWLTGIFFGCLAILSKEPAIVMVHVVLLGSLALEWRHIRALWKLQSGSRRMIAVAAYAVLIGVSLYIVEASPTRTNRFLSLNAPDLGQFIRDRIDYYSSLYFTIGARILLLLPIVGLVLNHVFRAQFNRNGPFDLFGIAILALVATLLLFTNILIALPLLTFAMLVLAVYPNPEIARVRRMLPFLASIVIAAATLLVTIYLVKTQLTEIAILTCVISAWAWCAFAEEIGKALKPWMLYRIFGRVAYASVGVVVIIGIAGSWPRIQKQERLLREVRDVRRNANDAIQWAAIHLPPYSLFTVTTYSLHGIDELQSLTASSDETKLHEQYTFAGGFVYYYLDQVGRQDIQHAYLEDYEIAPRVLEAMRKEPNAYLFLQSASDLTRFHGDASHPALLVPSDSLVARFNRGPYPCEIWKMK